MQPVPQPPPKKAPARITVVETVYHQPASSQGTASDCRYQRDVESDEYPYTYFPTLREEWQPVDLGWLKGKGVGMLVIENRPTQRQTHPSAVQKAEDSEAVVEVGLVLYAGNTPAFAMVLPGESCRYHPADGTVNSTVIRCRKGTCKARVTVLPA